MPINYILSCWKNKNINTIQIDEKIYNKTKEAKLNLSKLTSIEDKFDILLENYLEFEKELLIITLNYTYFNKWDYPHGQSNIKNINRRLINVLTTARMYLDQSNHDLNKLKLNFDNLSHDYSNKKSIIYDNRLGYRVMEELRNYAQHRDLPIHRIKFNSRSLPDQSQKPWEHRLLPYLDVSILEEDGSFKARILKEIKSNGLEYPVLPLVREYIEGLCELHIFLRNSLADQASNWEKILQEAIDQVTDNNHGEILGIFIAITNEDGEKIDIVTISKDLALKRSELLKKNSSFENLSTRFISNQHLESDFKRI